MFIKFLNVLIFFTIFLSASCARKPEFVFHNKQKILMGTVFEIKVFVDRKKFPPKRFEKIVQNAFLEIERLEKQMSEWIPDSPVSKISAAAGLRPVRVPEESLEVIKTALSVSSETGGAFDISFKPLGKLWNVKKRKIPPDKEEIKEALRLIGYENIVLDEKKGTVYLKKKGMSIGLGGIAKGYAAGKAAKVLKEKGIENFIINAGGDLYFSGSKNGKFWTTGIKNPDGGFFVKLKIKTDCAVATSGNYERFFIYKGKRYHHIIDARSGYPAYGLKSVTVISKNPALADAYATSFFILGYEKSLDIVRKKKDLAFIMVTEEGNILKSANFENMAAPLTWVSTGVL